MTRSRSIVPILLRGALRRARRIFKFCSDPSIAALTNRTDRKLFPLSQAERSHVVSYDFRGNATHESESFDRAAARSESSTAVPWATAPSRSVALAGRTIEAVDFASVTNRFTYDAFGQRTSATDGLGNVTVYDYDTTGRLLSTTDPEGFTTSYAYDAAGRRIATTDALGNTVRTDYDAAGRVVAESGATYPVLKGYDAYGRWTSLKTARDGETWDETQWTYDEASGVQTAKTYADGSIVRYSYDVDGRPTRTTWARGAWFENHYDEWGQIVAITHDAPTIDAVQTYDAFGRLATSSNNAAVYRYATDDRGLVTNEWAAIGGVTNTIVRDFDSYSRLARLRITDSDYDERFFYDECGRLIGIEIPDATVTYAYTPDSLDAGYSVHTSSNAVLSRVLYRDPQRRGLIASVSNLVNGVDSGSSFDYTYDALSRPVTRNRDAFGYNERGEVAWARYDTNTIADLYFYDSIGNFTSNFLRGAWTQFAANELNEYATITDETPRTLVYDADGNLLTNGVWSYSYDSENRLGPIYSNNVLVANKRYDAHSRRILTQSTGSLEYHFFDGWNELGKIFVNESAEKLQWFYWGKDIKGKIKNGINTGGFLMERISHVNYYPLYDNSGSVRLCLDQTGRNINSFRYDIFGNLLYFSSQTDESISLRFSTKSLEQSLYYFGYRFYSPSEERWLSRDPIEEYGGFNLYSFVENSPPFQIESLGLAPIRWGRCPCILTSTITSPATIFPFYNPNSDDSPSVFEHLRLLGPPQGAVLNQGQWFLSRYRGMITHNMNRYADMIAKWIANRCGQDNLSYNPDDKVTRVPISPYYNSNSGGGFQNRTHGPRPDRHKWETEWGDARQNKWESFAILGAFAIDITTPVTIFKQNTINSCSTYFWSTSMYIDDTLGLNADDDFPLYWKYLFPERRIKRAEWTLSGYITCCQICDW